MLFYIPVYTLLHYIEVFGGIAITPEEWVAFLTTCTDRSEMFMCGPYILSPIDLANNS
jgi:hypothetical protein